MTIPDPGVLVLDRQSYFRMLSARGAFAARTPSCGMSTVEVASHYRGLEGDAWPDDENMETLAPLGELENISRGLKEGASNRDMVLLSTGPVVDPALVRLGFDVGYFESRDSHFSSVFHEVLFGLSDPMREFGKRLNHQLLFSTREMASRLLVLRESLLVRGVDLESGGPSLEVIEIYGGQSFLRNGGIQSP